MARLSPAERVDESRRRTPLLDVHRRLGARVTEFAGWDMPLQYGGVVAEHNAVRNSVGVFDVSHLGKLRVGGAGAEGALQEAVTADVAGLEVGRASYALCLTEEGGCVDDVFVYRLSDDEWLVVPNAANVRAVADMIAASGGVVIDEWDRWAILAIQGPESFELVAGIWPDGGAGDLDLHAWCEFDVFGALGIMARTGYTGERGFELYAPAATAVRAFEAVLEAGAAPVGLGARDTLRLEMGYALYGHELTREISPLEAKLSWAIAWDTPFRGRAALEGERATGPARKLFAVRCAARGVPRQGHRVLAATTAIGSVTSGNFSPTLQTGIALALGPSASLPAVGARVAIEARGRMIEGDIVKPPFIEKR